jgi:sterol 24-C-methyltransferase
VLKPGGSFSGYEWLSTPAYNPSNARHRSIMADIELGNGLPDVRSIEQVRAARQRSPRTRPSAAPGSPLPPPPRPGPPCPPRPRSASRR